MEKCNDVIKVPDLGHGGQERTTNSKLHRKTTPLMLPFLLYSQPWRNQRPQSREGEASQEKE
jgi:hypothetical protein